MVGEEGPRSTGGGELQPGKMNIQDVVTTLRRADGVELPYSSEYYKMREVPGFVEQLSPGVSKLKEIFGNIEQFRFGGAKAVHEATAAEALGDRPDDSLPWFESLLDDCLERVHTSLDANKRENAPKEPTLVASASQNLQTKNSGVAIAQRKSLPGWGGRRQPFERVNRANVADKSHYKPQDKFSIPVDNSEEPFQPKLESLKGLIPESIPEKDQGRNDPELDEMIRTVVGNNSHRASYPHPLQATIDALEYQPSQLELGGVRMPRSMEFTKFVFVDTEAKLEAMAKDLKGAAELAVDLEEHEHRTFLGLTCLMQISTRKTDYVVDTLPLWKKIGVALAPVFADPKVVKVLHGSFNDIIWLQRDFGIYMVNLFDTYEASRMLQKERKSLAFLLETYCDVKADKKYQLADWRVRPLNKEMLMYARGDTHSLLYIYDVMRHELFHLGENVPQELKIPLREKVPKNALGVVLERSRLVSLQRYEKPFFSVDKCIKKHKLEEFNNVQKATCDALLEWREGLARKNDESRGYILNTNSLIRLAARLPGSVSAVKGALLQHDKFAQSRAQEILEIITCTKSSQKPRPGLCAAVPTPPPTITSGGSSKTTSNLTPKLTPPLNSTPAGILGTLVAGDGGGTSMSNGGHGILPIKIAQGSGFGAMMSGSSDSQGAKVAEINASFVLPFGGAVGPLAEGEKADGKETEEQAVAGKRSTANDIRDVMDEWKKGENEEELSPAGDEPLHKRKKARLTKAWDEGLQDYLPVPVKQAYSKASLNREQAVEGAGADVPSGVEGDEELMETVFKDTGLTAGREDLVSAELNEISKFGGSEVAEAAKKNDEPNETAEKEEREALVIPFDYAKAKEDKKKRIEMESCRKNSVKNNWGNSDKSVFKKPRRSKTHARTNNKSGRFKR
ncbi:hypothetical protein BSKO_01076 [Bryopsis sp. KO-2023]|nr:hypothetical protein BSKO_01076 [Bryopsis sp. KO-2023]